MSEEIKIGDLAHPSKGSFKIGPFGSSLKKEDLQNFGIPVAGIENILPNQFVPRFRRFISEQKFSELADYEIKSNDVLVSTMGTIGRAAIVPDGIGRVIIDSHLFRMRLDCSKVFPAYLCYAINGYDGLKRNLKQMARGAIMDGLNTTILKECSIPLASLAEQKRIAAILDKADRLRRQRRYAQTLSDSFLQSVFIKMFGDRRNFEIVELESLLAESPKNGLYLPAEKYGSGSPIIRIDNFYDGILGSPVNFKRVLASPKEIEEFKVQNGHILINRVNSLEYLGKCAYVQGLKENTIFESNMMRLRVNGNLVKAIYLVTYLTSEHGKSQILTCAKKAVNQASINQTDVESFLVPLPPLPLQEKFAAIVQKFERIRRQQREATRQAEHLFQTLLQRAFRGEL